MSKRTLPGRRWRILAHEKGERLELSDRGQFDELVCDDWLHIEQMSPRHYWMQLGALRIEINLESTGECRILIEDDEYTIMTRAEVAGHSVSWTPGKPWWREPKRRRK